MKETTLTIGGMSCDHCVKAVDDALKSIEGVEVEKVKIGHAAIRYDENKVNHTSIVGVIETEGYRVEG